MLSNRWKQWTVRTMRQTKAKLIIDLEELKKRPARPTFLGHSIDTRSPRRERNQGSEKVSAGQARARRHRRPQVVSVLPQLFCSWEGTALLIGALAATVHISQEGLLKIEHCRRRDMGEVIGFKRRKLALISEHGRPPINLVEPITADKFPTWRQVADTAPSEYCAPERDGA